VCGGSRSYTHENKWCWWERGATGAGGLQYLSPSRQLPMKNAALYCQDDLVCIKMHDTNRTHTHTHSLSPLGELTDRGVEHQTHDTRSSSVFRGCCCNQTPSISHVFSAQYMNSLSLSEKAALLSNMCCVLSSTLTALHPKETWASMVRKEEKEEKD